MPKETERKDVTGYLERLKQSLVVLSQLEQIDGGVEAKTDFGGMDLAFVKPDGSLVGLSLAGWREVVGLVVALNQRDLDLRLRSMEETTVMGDLFAQGARVIGLTAADLGRWLDYYRDVAKYLPVLGGRTWDQSGLKKYDQEKVTQSAESLKRIVVVPENKTYLNSNGAVKLVLVEGEKGVYTFANQSGGMMDVILRNVSTPEMEGTILKETVASQEVVGVVLPRLGETKIDLYVRTYNLGQQYSKLAGREVVFAAGTTEQFRLWDSWGLSPEVMKEGLVSESELLRFLSLGESNLSPGLLARADSIGDGQWALLDEKLMPGVITFVGRIGPDGRDIRQLPPVQVFDPRARKRGKFGTVPLNGAVGIIRVPEEMNFEQMKQVAKPIEDRFAHLMNTVGRGGEKPRVIFLTPSLMQSWRNGNFWATEEQVRWLDQTRRREYGFGESMRGGGDVEGVFYSAAHFGPAVGGGFRTLLSRKKNHDSMVLLDTSTPFDDRRKPSYERYADALITAVRDGRVPMWPNLLGAEAALHSIKVIAQSVEKPGAEKDPVVVYLATQIAAGLSEEKIKKVLGDKLGQLVCDIGNANQGLFGDPKTKAVYPVSHIHVDHIGLTQSTRSGIPLLMSLGSRLMAEARDDLNPIGREILTVPEWWNSSRGRATPREARNIVTLKNGEEYISDGIRLELSGVEHSTIGAVARRTGFLEDPGLVVVDSGDFRRWGRTVSVGSKTQKTIERWAGKKMDWLILETTAIRKGANLSVDDWRGRLEKTVPLTDEPLFDGIKEVIAQSRGKTVVIFSSPYDLARNVTLMDAAADSGREVVLGVRHAMIAARLRSEQELLGAEASVYDDLDLVIPRYGLYLTEGAKTYTATKALTTELQAGGTQIYDRNNILSGSDGRVLLFNPFGNELASLDNLPLEERLEVIWSSSVMYSQMDMNKFLNDKAYYLLKYAKRIWAEPNFWSGRLPFKLSHPGEKKGILHRSGHSTPLELLWFLDHLADKKLKILLHHTEKPEAAMAFIKGAFPKADWEIVDGLEHYNPSVLPTREKRWAGPLLRLSK